MFTEHSYGTKRYWPLLFYTEGDVLPNSSIDDSFTFPSAPFRITDFRIHFSTSVVSANELKIVVSAVLGSNYNINILTQSMLSNQDIIFQFGIPLQFNSNDHIRIFTSTFSVANSYGIEVNGWAVVG